jgi:hypothetical protein
MEKLETTETGHRHPCDHECWCVLPGDKLCDWCTLADVFRVRHGLAGMDRHEVIARLSMALFMGGVGGAAFGA